LDTLTVTYSGDGDYIGGETGTATVTVTSSYGLSASNPSGQIAPGASATSTVTVNTTNGYVGTVTIGSCTLTSGPTNQSGNAPACAVGSANSVNLTSTTTSGTVTVSVSTTAATSGALVRPALGRNNELTLAGLGGAALALLALLGIPKQRRAIRSILGMLAVVLMLGGLAACGGGGGGGSSGGGGGSGGGGTSNPGTAAGTYTFTVSGTGSDTAKTTASTTFTVTVNN
jgi:hypothetical protein